MRSNWKENANGYRTNLLLRREGGPHHGDTGDLLIDNVFHGEPVIRQNTGETT